MTGVTQNLAEVGTRITHAAERFGREPGSIRLVAVSKRHPASAIAAAIAAGQHEFGESYFQEAREKMLELGDGHLIVWHFIGRIQANKTHGIATSFDWVHTVDRLRIARRLNEQRGSHGPALNVCLQVEVAGDPARPGVTPQDLPALAAGVAAMPRLRLRGLMCMPPPEENFDAQRRYFRVLRECYEGLRAAGHPLDTLSAGMSADAEAAIAEGATHLRIGTAVFGPRER